MRANYEHYAMKNLSGYKTVAYSVNLKISRLYVFDISSLVILLSLFLPHNLYLIVSSYLV